MESSLTLDFLIENRNILARQPEIHYLYPGK
jgi:hypothetical protein